MIPVQTGTQCAGRGSSKTNRGASQGSAAWPLPKRRRGEGRTIPAVTYSAGKGLGIGDEAECRLCGEPDQTICDRCGQAVCFGCFDSDLCLCVECAMDPEGRGGARG